MESRIRGLLNKLESVNGLALAHPFIEGFDNTYNCTSFDEVDAATRGAGIKTQESGQGMTVYTRTFYIGLYFKPVPGNSSCACVCMHKQTMLNRISYYSSRTSTTHRY